MGIVNRINKILRREGKSTVKSQNEQLWNRGTQWELDGGLFNELSGLGGKTDPARYAGYARTTYGDRTRLDTLFGESWMMSKAIAIPAIDMTTRWRTWDEDSNDMKDAERGFGTRKFIRRLVIAGRLYGTACGIIVTKGDKLSDELDPDKLRKDHLENIPIVDRFQLEIPYWNADYRNKKFGRPALYQWSPEFTAGKDTDPPMTVQEDIHPSRILRYDGIKLPSYTANEYHGWGIPVANHVLSAILQEEQASAASAHLAEHASIPIYRGDYAAAMMGAEGLSTAEDLAKDVAKMMSVWRTIFVDKAVEVERLQVTFSGLDEILDRLAIRVAAAAEIPVTRFWGRSPAGMNATGEADAENYAQLVCEKQESLRYILETLDLVVARNAGISGDVPEYTWPSLIEVSDEQKAAAAKSKAEALKIAIDSFAISEEEMRSALDGDEVFGELDGKPPEQPDPMQMPGGGMGMGGKLKMNAPPKPRAI